MRKHTGFLVSTSLSTYGKNMMQCEQNLWTKSTCTSSSWKGSLFSEGSMDARTSAQFAISPWQRESRVIILFSALYLVGLLRVEECSAFAPCSVAASPCWGFFIVVQDLYAAYGLTARWELNWMYQMTMCHKLCSSSVKCTWIAGSTCESGVERSCMYQL